VTHEEVKSRFSELLDGEMAGADDREIRGHLEGCEECRRAWDEFRLTFQAFKSAAMSEAPPYLVDRIKHKIHRRSRGRFFQEPPPLLFRVPYEIFSLIIILLALMMYMIFAGLNVVTPRQIHDDAASDGGAQVEKEAK